MTTPTQEPIPTENKKPDNSPDPTRILENRGHTHFRISWFLLLAMLLSLIFSALFVADAFGQDSAALKDTASKSKAVTPSRSRGKQPASKADDLLDGSQSSNPHDTALEIIDRSDTNSYMSLRYDSIDGSITIVQGGKIQSVKNVIFKYHRIAPRERKPWYIAGEAWLTNSPSRTEMAKLSPPLFRLITKGIVVLIGVFAALLLWQAYKYHARLARYYWARADALLLEGKKFTDIVSHLSPDDYHIGTPKFSQEQLLSLVQLAVAKEKIERPSCCCCRACCKKCDKEKKSPDETQSESNCKA